MEASEVPRWKMEWQCCPSISVWKGMTIDDVCKNEVVIWDPTDSIATVFTTGQHQFQENPRILLEEESHLQDPNPQFFPTPDPPWDPSHTHDLVL